MALVPVQGKLDLLGGARIETSDQNVVSESPFVSTVAPVDVQLKNTDVLPSINATYRLNPQMNLRGGYAVTLSRPELREMSPFDMYNYETGYSEVGNPIIQSTPIRNADLRWEFYPGARELLSASLFAKNLDRPIENIVLGSSGGYILQPVNGVDGRLRGFEVESRLGVGRVWDVFSDAFKLKRAGKGIDRWAINFNYSRIESSVRVKTSNDANGNPIYRDGPLQGQSSYALNAGLFYGTSDVQGSLMYNSFGPRLAQFGAGAYPASLPDIYEYPPTSLDFTLSKRVGQFFSLRLSGENLLNKPTKFTQLGLVTREYNGGRTFTLTMNIKG
jgi:outer membrane receptor protein involved in Fe transport